MSKNQLIDYVERRYGLDHDSSSLLVEQSLAKGLTWLDIVRMIDFNSRFNRYYQTMRFA